MRIFLILLCMLWSSSVQADEAAMVWHMVPAESHINFTALIEDRPSEGSFPSFRADIRFDPNRLDQSRVEVEIDMNQIEASYPDVAENLRKAPWFAVADFPKARFVGREFASLGDNIYGVTGDLTLRDATRTETLTFTLTDYSPGQARIEGDMKINRLDYGIGQGSWSSTSFVAAEVNLHVVVSARR